MVFASGVFLYFFLPIFLGIYYTLPRRMRSTVIAVASYVFYGWWRPDFVILMWVSTAVDYTAGQRITQAQARQSKGKPWLWLSLIVNLGLLGYFKYFNFGVDSLNDIFVHFGMPTMQVAKIVLPVGISFYTFQTLSYTIDVYRGRAAKVRSFQDFMCYVALFPQLVAGPIVRYNTVADQLVNRTHTLEKFYRGVLAFQAGMAKKILIADVLGGLADEAFAASHLSPGYAWLGALAYTFQIYFDFSGYSDMAIGLGLMIGFQFPVNFDQPYRSISITDFWRRWHISLSSFLRDYLYIPLGGNRKGVVRTYVNLALTMLLGGLWHGANWTFLIWGAYQGFWLVVERLSGKSSWYAFTPKAVQMALTFVLVIFGWVFFRAENLSHALEYFDSMFGLAGTHGALALRPIHAVSALAAVVVIWGTPTTQALLFRASIPWVVFLQFAFWGSLIHLHFVSHVPFLYFQF
ncbi:MAG: MBOAT family protein [Planctomycetes bacterium]|nr:MBOAT family protein [Planctomycetota bacterium]MCB9910600.1 MBOAT family protein [Planctomycetota bacterium]